MQATGPGAARSGGSWRDGHRRCEVANRFQGHCERSPLVDFVQSNTSIRLHEPYTQCHGTQGSPNAEDWLVVDLLAPHKLNEVRLYFFNDKSYNPQQNASRDTYRQPSTYTVQYHDGSDWVDVPDQVRSPEMPAANRNTVTFPQLTAQRLRVLMTRAGTFGTGLKEIQVFNTVPTSLDAIGVLVDEFRAAGQVTKEGATRLHSKLDQADKELARNRPAAAIRNLEQFIADTASLPQYVPGQEARWALVDEAEQMIAQLGGTPSSG